MRKIKKIVVLFVIVLLLSMNVVEAETQDKIMIIDNISTWKYYDNKWYNIDDYSDGKFSVYINNDYYGMYIIKKTDEYNLYDNENKLVSYNGSLLAISSNFDIKPKSYILQKINDEDIIDINNMLHSSFKYNDFLVKEHVIVDLNNNGEEDIIINVSNLDAENEQETYLNFIYIKLDNGEIQVLKKDIVEAKDALNAPRYNIKYVIDNNNTYNSIIIHKRYFSYAGEAKNILYESHNGIYNETIVYDIKKDSDNSSTNKKDYTLYIFCGILLIVFLLGYLIFNKVKNNGNKMDV